VQVQYQERFLSGSKLFWGRAAAIDSWVYNTKYQKVGVLEETREGAKKLGPVLSLWVSRIYIDFVGRSEAETP
jgi:hypothetical protein